MCGIGGILRVWPVEQRELALRTPHAESIPERWLDILDDSIKHRGPDGQGRFRDRAIRADGCVVDVAFVHRRLSIIDHAGGAQPMVSVLPLPYGSAGRGEGLRNAEAVGGFPLLFHGKPNAPVEYRCIAPPDGRNFDCVAVVFNGCIYNHRDLRGELQRAGHVFTTDHSDTEVLVHGWREWGDELTGKLEGMFALVVWSSHAGEFVLARDMCGEKPLYHAFLGADPNLSSESESTPSALFASSSSSHRPCACTLAFGSTAAGLTRLLAASSNLGKPDHLSCWIEKGYDKHLPFERRLSQVHFSEIRFGSSDPWPQECRLRAYWFEPDPSARRRSGKELTADAVDALIHVSVAQRLEADVPLGCFLSGGIDSSLIAAHAQALTGCLNTFTVRMPDDRYDESVFASAVAKQLGTRHETLDVQASPSQDLPLLIHQLGLPFGDSSILPTYWLASAARRAVRVSLSGDGGDELFAGYERYVAVSLFNRRSTRLLRLIPRSWFPHGHPKSKRERLRRLRFSLSSRYSDLGVIFSAAQMDVLLRGSSMARWMQLDGPGAWAPAPLREIEQDFCLYLPDDLMRKADTASMAVALEVRAPLLDSRIVEAAMCAPISSLMPHGQRKGLLRQVARKYLPAEIVDRPKMGFAIPIGDWFRTDYGGLRTMLLDHLNSTEPFGPPSLGIDLNMTYIRQMLDEHLGTGPSGLVKRDHSQRLYMLLVLSIWAKWLGGLR